MKVSQITQTTRPGANRTGLQPHPELLEEMLQGTAEFGATSMGDVDNVAQVRVRYAREAEPAGTMPPSESVATERLPLIDKLGARLQFERTGVRLYEHLMSKLEAYGSFPGGPSREDLKLIRDEEHHHVVMVKDLIIGFGGDPTALTPMANLQATASRGILDVLVDPRTNLIECLDAILVIELADTDSWRMLGIVAQDLGDKNLIAAVDEAEQTEAEHLTKVRGWMLAAEKARGGRPLKAAPTPGAGAGKIKQ
jgi:hypothetical protein